MQDVEIDGAPNAAFGDVTSRAAPCRWPCHFQAASLMTSVSLMNAVKGVRPHARTAA